MHQVIHSPIYTFIHLNIFKETLLRNETYIRIVISMCLGNSAVETEVPFSSFLNGLCLNGSLRFMTQDWMESILICYVFHCSYLMPRIDIRECASNGSTAIGYFAMRAIDMARKSSGCIGKNIGLWRWWVSRCSCGGMIFQGSRVGILRDDVRDVCETRANCYKKQLQSWRKTGNSA